EFKALSNKKIALSKRINFCERTIFTALPPRLKQTQKTCFHLNLITAGYRPPTNASSFHKAHSHLPFGVFSPPIRSLDKTINATLLIQQFTQLSSTKRNGGHAPATCYRK